MTDATTRFVEELKKRGYGPVILNENRIQFDYVVPAGKFTGQKIKIGLDISADWDLTPPGGINISPRLLPINPNATTHPEKVAESPFGESWEYWSRPYPSGLWQKCGKTVKDYLRYVKDLFYSQ